MQKKLTNSRARRLIEAGRTEFGRHGLAGARVADVVRRAGVNQQLLFYYFGSKRGLYDAVLRDAEREIERAVGGIVTGPGRALERLGGALGALFDHLSARMELVGLLTAPERGGAAPLAPAVKRLVVLFAEGQGRGEVRDDLDPHLAAAQALLLLVGFLRLESLVAASAPPLAAYEGALRERWRDAAVGLVLEGVAAR